MKTELKQTEKITEFKNNTVGNRENEKNRNTALNVLITSNEIDSEKKKNGYKWMVLGKTSILVHPSRIKELKKSGYKLL